MSGEGTTEPDTAYFLEEREPHRLPDYEIRTPDLRARPIPAISRSCYAADPHQFTAVDGLIFCSRCGRGPVA